MKNIAYEKEFIFIDKKKCVSSVGVSLGKGMFAKGNLSFRLNFVFVVRLSLHNHLSNIFYLSDFFW